MSEQQTTQTNSNNNGGNKPSFRYGNGSQRPKPKFTQNRDSQSNRDSLSRNMIHDNREPKVSTKSFENIFCDRVSWAARHTGAPKHAEGFMFFSCDAASLDVNDPNKAASYKRPWMGKPVILTNEQMEHILNYLGISDNELSRDKRDKSSVKPDDNQRSNPSPRRRGKRGGKRPMNQRANDDSKSSDIKSEDNKFTSSMEADVNSQSVDLPSTDQFCDDDPDHYTP